MYLYLDINTHFKVSIITPMNSLKVLQIRMASLEVHKYERWWSSCLQGPAEAEDIRGKVQTGEVSQEK